MIRNVLLIGLAGGIGSMARYLCHKWIYHLFPSPFPLGTFMINITGCLLIGFFWGLSLRSNIFSEELKLFLITGFCGGFTTFSAFSFEGLSLIKEHRLELFFLYIGASVVTGLAATWLGLRFFN